MFSIGLQILVTFAAVIVTLLVLVPVLSGFHALAVLNAFQSTMGCSSVAISKSIHSPAGAFIGAVSVDFSLDTLTEVMREQEHGSKEVLSTIKSINTVTMEVQTVSEEMP